MRADPGVIRAATVVGRGAELDMLDQATRDARAGRARCVLLVGEGGIGKTRLIGEVTAAAEGLGLAVFAGRAPIATPVAFSVVSDALRSWLRDHRIADPISPYDRGLALVLPEWPVAGGPVELEAGALRLLAVEGVVRLVRAVIATTDGAVFIADDLHAADPDSLETIRYLAGARLPGLTIVGSLRPAESDDADELASRLVRDGVASVIDVQPLDERAVGELVAALLGAHAPSPLVADVLARTDGVPLFVEELVRGHVDAGTVLVDPAGTTWRGDAGRVPGTVRALVEARLARLDASHRDVIVAGAVVGDFAPELMRAVTAADDDIIAAALDAGVRAGLLELMTGAMVFRHAIIRDAVLDGALPHVVDTMHRRAAAALSGELLDASDLESRARHLAAVGETDEAAAALTDAADRWLGAHALLAGERAARSAIDFAREPSRRAAAADVLARTLAAQGRWSDALALDELTVADHGDTPERRLRRAGCALEAGRPEQADGIIAVALARDQATPGLVLLAGRAALVRGDAGEALDRASQVRTEPGCGIDARLAALELEGRAHDFLGDRDTARACWETQARDAAATGRTQAQLRAVVQLGKVELFAGQAPDRLREAVDLAHAAGSLVELAWAEENLAIGLAVLDSDLDAGLSLLDTAISRARHLHLDQLAYLVAARAMMRSYTIEDVDDELAEAEALLSSSDLLLHTTSMRGTIALRASRWHEAIEWFERSVALARSMPGVVPMDGICWLPWALLGAGRRDDASVALAAAHATPDLGRFYTRPIVVAAATPLLTGDADAFDAVLAAAPPRMDLDLGQMRMIAATVMGAPDAVRWLREAYDCFEHAGALLDAERARQAMRAAGGAVPRRRRVALGIAPELAAAGVTAREAEVLRGIGQALPNAEIAAKLFISVRTVEAHTSSLLSKLGARSRGELTVLAGKVAFEP